MTKGRKKSVKNVMKNDVKKTHNNEEMCDPGKTFHAIDGSSYSSIKELADALQAMSDDTFYYHVTDNKNDFHNWVKDVFHEEKLADELLKARTREKHETVLLRHLLKNK